MILNEFGVLLLDGPFVKLDIEGTGNSSGGELSEK